MWLKNGYQRVVLSTYHYLTKHKRSIHQMWMESLQRFGYNQLQEKEVQNIECDDLV
jgi:hypothetical protein